MAIALSVLVVGMTGLLVIANNVIITKKGGSALTDVLGVTTRNDFYTVNVSAMRVTSPEQNISVKRATATVTVLNTSDEVLQIAPGLQMFLVSNAGTVYPMTARYLKPGVVLGGALAAKSSTTLNVDYDLPVNETPKTFTFQADSAKPIANIEL